MYELQGQIKPLDWKNLIVRHTEENCLDIPNVILWVLAAFDSESELGFSVTTIFQKSEFSWTSLFP